MTDFAHIERQAAMDTFADRVRTRALLLSRSELQVARFIDENRAVAIASSAAALGKRAGTSDATVVRAVQALGFGSLSELRQTLAASLAGRSTPVDHMRRTLETAGQDAGRAVDAVLDLHATSLQKARTKKVKARIGEAVSILRSKNRIVTFGIGPSAPLANYVRILLSRGGRESRSLDAAGITLADQLLDLRSADGLLVLAYGPRYPEVVAVFDLARRLNIPIVAVTDNLDPKLSRHATLIVPVRRGDAGGTALHGATMIVLEAIVLGILASDQDRTLHALQRLDDLRGSIAG